MSENPVPPPPVPVPEKKGIPAIGWIGIGCGTILVILVIVISLAIGFCRQKWSEFEKNPEKMAAEMIIKANPDLELVKSDGKNGEMTVRTKEGKEMTFTYDEIRKGKISFTDSDGNSTEIGASDLSKVPAWVPRVPGISGQLNAFSSDTADSVSGFYTAQTTESADDVEAYFNAEADRLGLGNSSNTSINSNGIANRTVSRSQDGRQLTLTLTTQPNEPLMVQVGYSDKK